MKIKKKVEIKKMGWLGLFKNPMKLGSGLGFFYFTFKRNKIVVITEFTSSDIFNL
jgi:hypothetical protein